MSTETPTQTTATIHRSEVLCTVYVNLEDAPLVAGTVTDGLGLVTFQPRTAHVIYRDGVRSTTCLFGPQIQHCGTEPEGSHPSEWCIPVLHVASGDDDWDWLDTATAGVLDQHDGLQRHLRSIAMAAA